MNTQNQIKRTLSEPANTEYVHELLKGNDVLIRSELASLVCQHYGFHDPRGQEQRAGCLKALRSLEEAGHFILPAPRTYPGRRTPRRLANPVDLPVEVPCQVGEIRELELVRVTTLEQMRIWNELMIQEHPQGAGPLVGRQLRYLIGSQHGWLGGFGFASAALQMADRDAWIGWDANQRRSHRQFIVGMSRFLIRPSVKCRNLASKALSMSLALLPDDFEREYGYRLWLVESFVDRDYSGTCYRAANWIEVGKTKGRGRQDRFNQVALSTKTIYIYPLEKDFRKRIGLSPNAGLGPLTPHDGLESEDWATYEFGGAPLGDARLSKRLVKVVADKAKAPDRTYNGVAEGNWADAKGYYRMIDQPEESAVNMANILEPHRKRTERRMMGQKTVLCIQDGCDLMYTNLNQCEGLGPIGGNQTGTSGHGLHLHSTLAVAPDGVPLGVLKAQCTAPEAKFRKGGKAVQTLPIEEKKTFVWIEHHRDLVALAHKIPQTRLVDVCDREADFFEMFDEQRRDPCVDVLIRAKHNRKMLSGPLKLFAAVRQTPVRSRVRTVIPRQSARPKKSKQKARPARPGRTADMVVRYMQFQLPSPSAHKDKSPIDIWVVHALEENPPENTAPIEWFLLTTLDINSASDAEQCLRWYALRWRIEDWHRVLKSGCGTEELAHETAERLRRAIAVNLVIAWRIMLMTLLGRECPELSAEILFSDIELRTLQAYAEKRRLKPPVLLGDAVRLIAKIGGYLGRNRDPPPGHQLLWRGIREFHFMCLGFSLLDSG